MNTGQCLGGPQNGVVMSYPAYWFLQPHISKPDVLAYAFGLRDDFGPVRFTLYRWRRGYWEWEHYQERDDLPANRN